MIKDKIINCEWEIICPIGHTVWVGSDGSWSTQLSLKGPRKQITLGMLILCPLWRKQPLTPELWGKVKRSSIDPWQHLSTEQQ